MEISEVYIKLLEPHQQHGRLRAYASVTFDQSFAVHDIKVVQGIDRLFVAMPSRRLTLRCSYCRTQNQVSCRGRTCVRCEELLPEPKRINENKETSSNPFVDIFHPINSNARALVDAAVLHAYQEALDEQHAVLMEVVK